MAQPLEVRYSRPFYLSMLVIGMVCAVAAIKLALDPSRLPEGLVGHRPMFLTVLLVGILATMGVYMWRAMRRLTTPIPVICVRDEGIVLTIGQPRLFRWSEIRAAGIGRHRMRPRLELTVEHKRFDELNLPRMFADDNFMAVRQKPDTIGITGQGLDHSLADVVAALRARRIDIVQR